MGRDGPLSRNEENVDMEQLAFQKPPPTEKHFKDTLCRLVDNEATLALSLLDLVHEVVPEPLVNDLWNLVTALRDNMTEQYQVSLREAEYWHWMTARLYYLHFGRHLEDLKAAASTRAVPVNTEGNIVDIRAVLKERANTVR
jgi:hypothetical protein